MYVCVYVYIYIYTHTHTYIYLIIFLINLFYFLFLYVLGLHCCMRAFSSCSESGLLFVAVHRLLIAVASLVAELGSRCAGFSSCGTRAQQLWNVGSVVVAHGLSVCGLQQLWHAGSVVVAHGLSCSAACGIFPDQGLNPCPLHWQADS